MAAARRLWEGEGEGREALRRRLKGVGEEVGGFSVCVYVWVYNVGETHTHTRPTPTHTSKHIKTKQQAQALRARLTATESALNGAKAALVREREGTAALKGEVEALKAEAGRRRAQVFGVMFVFLGGWMCRSRKRGRTS